MNGWRDNDVFIFNPRHKIGDDDDGNGNDDDDEDDDNNRPASQ